MDEELDQNEHEFDTIMREQPLPFQDDSDDESYEENHRGRSRIRSNKTQESQHEPIYYVVDRGLDLPPGVERPNLFDGHPDSWRAYNADDIGAYQAMIINRSRDLAAHLYNTHVIRRRARDTARNNPGVVDKEPLRVNKRWAAWPLHSAIVPRSSAIFQRRTDALDIFQKEPDPRPSAELEECITAFILKTSKETFQARELNFEEIADNPRNKLDDGDELMDDELEKKEEEEDEEAPVDTRILQPIALLDDEKSLRQLRPVARNVISHVDRLLYGLHCAMKGRKFEEDSGDEQWSDSDEEDHENLESPKRRSRSRSRGRRSARQESRELDLPRRSNSPRMTPGPDTEDENLPEVSQTRAQSRDSSAGQDTNQHTKGRLKLRDWSEVMGLASMMGLPTPAVLRASKRCADLFGEDMEFRKMPEGRVKKRSKTGTEEEYAYTESESEIDSAPPSPQPIPLPTPRPNRSRLAIPGLEPRVAVKMPKAKVALPKPKAKIPKSRPKTPSRRSSKIHKTPAIVPPSSSPSPAPEELPEEPVPEPAAEDTEEAVDQEPKTARKGVHRKADILCPVRTCTRHTNGFSRKWNLNQHLRKAHGINVAPGNEASIEHDDSVIIID
ncbi:RNA polymerase I specific transcription initiation factor, RRN9 [Penicillium italicum]|uniref:RNA polymerase I specific transcription initiation factor, RRN9 n=1 Tax=Penicillium italicum TaxID=40296 RepID=A0A0A2LGJ6_PENIT|nr:RNA polymerase I specific transcription initiation factor, RRN9 [Penicillium italicum]